LIFVVDSNDTTRMDETREELCKLLEEDEIRKAILFDMKTNKIFQIQLNQVKLLISSDLMQSQTDLDKFKVFVQP
jgi:hypothetical protein